jgi:hypothetical protein
MTLYDFTVMEKRKKAIAARSGPFLAFKDEEQYRLVLYKVDSFFVEVYYQQGSNAIAGSGHGKVPGDYRVILTTD